MSKGEAPKPPDPKQTAAAQTGQNVGTSVANTVMGNVNQYTPDGSLTYHQTGTYNWRDPNSGQVHQLPQYSAVTTLSPEAQALRDANNRGSLALANLGADQAQRVDGILGQPFDPANISPSRAPRTSQTPNASARPNARPIDMGGGRFGSTPDQRAQIGPAQTQPIKPNQAGESYNLRPVNYGPSERAPTLFQDGRQLPNVSDGAQPLQSLQVATRAPGASNAAQLGANQASDTLQTLTSADQIAPAAQQAAASSPQGPQLATGYENDFGAQRQEVIDSLMGRIDEERDRDLEGLRTQLLNSGIREGTEAYDREMENFADRTNRNRLNAIMAGGQEQTRLVNMARDEAAFGNSAVQQMFANEVSRYGIGEDARRFDLSRSDANRFGEFDRGEDIRRFDRADQMASFDRNEDIRRFDRSDELASFDRGEDVRRYDDAMAFQRFGVNEDVRRFDRSDQLASYDRGEDARRYGDAMQMGLFGLGADQIAFNNTTAQQDFGNRQAIQARGDANRTNQFNQQRALWDDQDRARAQALDEAYAARAQPINEISALLSGSQVTTPRFATNQPAPMPTTDIAGLTQQNYANQFSTWNARNQQNQALMGGLFGLGSSAILAA